MKIILFLILSIITVSSISTSYAYLGYFEEFQRQIYTQPRICIFQPDDPRVDDITWRTWYRESKKAIQEWESLLRQHSTSSKGNWHIDYAEIPLYKKHMINDGACDIKVNFVDVKQSDANGWYYPATKEIDIIMVQMTYCSKKYIPAYGVSVDVYCRGDKLERASKMANTLRHEIGHAFGLGHYVTNDPTIARSWIEHPTGVPSIMTFSHYNEEKRNITSLDINQVFKVHPNGFGEKRNEIPLFSDDHPKPSITDTVNFSNVPIKSILIKRGEPTLEKISGTVPATLFKRGFNVEILIIKPDRSYEINTAKVNEKRYFEYTFRFDEKSTKGKYQIQTSYFGNEINKLEFLLTDNLGTNYAKGETTTSNAKSNQSTNITTRITVKEQDFVYIPSKISHSNKITTSISWKQISGENVKFTTNNGMLSFQAPAISDNKDKILQFQSSIMEPSGVKSSETVIITIKPKQPTSASADLKQTNLPTKPSRQLLKNFEMLKESINDTNSQIIKAYTSIKYAQQSYQNEKSKYHSDKAYTLYKKAISSMAGLKAVILNIETSNYSDLTQIRYDEIKSKNDMISSYIKYINQELDFAKKAHSEEQQLQDASQTTKPKQCFLFLC